MAGKQKRMAKRMEIDSKDSEIRLTSNCTGFGKPVIFLQKHAKKLPAFPNAVSWALTVYENCDMELQRCIEKET